MGKVTRSARHALEVSYLKNKKHSCTAVLLIFAENEGFYTHVYAAGLRKILLISFRYVSRPAGIARKNNHPLMSWFGTSLVVTE